MTAAARLGHTVTGDAGAPVVVLSSSLGATREMWRPQIDALSQRFRVVAYDHRGHGESDVPDPPYRIDDLGHDVLALLDDLGLDRVHVAGLSLGGMVGQWLASHAPDRLDRLAVLCTTAHFDDDAPWRERAARVRADGVAAIADTVVSRWFTPVWATAHPDVVERHHEMILTTPTEGYAGCCDAIGALDLTESLPSVTTPTLVIGGLQDASIPPEHQERIAAAIPGARLELLDGAAHLANVEQSAAVTRLLVEHFGGSGP